MAGLLDFLNTDESRMGLSLLASAGSRPDNLSFGARLQEALGNFDGYKRQKAQDEEKRQLMALQMQQHQMAVDQARATQAKQQGLQALAKQFAKPGQKALSPLGGDADAGILPSAGRAATAPSFDFGGYANAALEGGLMDPAAAMTMQQQMQKESSINKLDVKDFTPASVQKFAATRNYGDLVRMDGAHFANTGGQTTAFDKFTGQPLNSVQNTQSPDNAASTAVTARGQNMTNSLGWANNALAKKRLEHDVNVPAEDEISPMTKRMVAQQYLAGDNTALQNYGRGAQGAKNLNAIRTEIATQANAMGLSGADIAARMAEFGGVKAGQRTAGTRTANLEMAAAELTSLVPLALDASKNVPRSGLLPFGKAQIMFDSNTNDPHLREFAMANNALVNVYGQVMSRGGIATVSDKDHAREILSTAFDQPSYEAAVKQLMKETKAAQAAPGVVRKQLSEAVSDRDKPHGGDQKDVEKPAPKATMRWNQATGKLEKVQ